MKIFGVSLIFIGLHWALFAFTMDTTVENTYNIGLISQQQNYIQGSGITLIIGVMLLIFGTKKEDKVNPPYISDNNPVDKMTPVSDKRKIKNNQSNTLLLSIIGVTVVILLLLSIIFKNKYDEKSSQVEANATEMNVTEANATEANVTEANATEANVTAPETEANGVGEAEGSCYDLGYKYVGCTNKSSLGLPCDTGTDFVMPERCRNNADTERGILDAVKSVSQQYNTETTQSPPLATLSEATDESIIFGVVEGLDPNGDGFLSIRNVIPKNGNSREIGKLYNGDTVEIVEKQGHWYKIKLKDSDGYGWCHENWVKVRING